MSFIVPTGHRKTLLGFPARGLLTILTELPDFKKCRYYEKKIAIMNKMEICKEVLRRAWQETGLLM